jgi:hypothetical protein
MQPRAFLIIQKELLMTLQIILNCIFGISANFPGIQKQSTIEISNSQFKIIRDEEGNEYKLSLCFKTWGRKADLAWYESLGD